MNIVVGVTGGIAAYKAVQLVRLLIGDGHEVHVVPTEDALRLTSAIRGGFPARRNAAAGRAHA